MRLSLEYSDHPLARSSSIGWLVFLLVAAICMPLAGCTQEIESDHVDNNAIDQEAYPVDKSGLIDAEKNPHPRFLMDDLIRTMESIEPFRVKSSGGWGKGKGDTAKIILLGMDGITWKVLTPLLKRGLLPNFNKLLKRASYGLLDTDIGLSPVSWTSIATGKSAIKTMSTGHVGTSPWKNTSKSIRTKRIWDILAKPGGKGLAIIDYYFLPGPGEYPEAILFAKNHTYPTFSHPDGYFESVEKITEINDPEEDSLGTIDHIAHTFAKGDFDFFAGIDFVPDALQHSSLFYFYLKYADEFARLKPVDKKLVAYYINTGEQIARRYRLLDKIVGRVSEKYPKDYFFIVSDHGFRTSAPWIEINFSEDIIRELGGPFGSSTQDTMEEVRLNGLACKARRREKLLALEFLQDTLTGKAVHMTFRLAEYEFYPGEDKQSARLEQIERSLKDLIVKKNPHDLPLFDVHAKKDRVIISVSPEAVGRLRYPIEDSRELPLSINRQFSSHGEQDPGVLIAAGPGIRKGFVISKAKLYDVTPTILYLAGKPVGKDMDGEVLSEMINPKIMKRRPAITIPTHDDEKFKSTRTGEMTELTPEKIEQLKALGYLN